MKLSPSKIQRYCRKQGKSLSTVLREAGVSRTAYYSLARRGSVLPRSIHAMAETLGTGVEDLLEEATITTAADAGRLVEQASRIVSDHPKASFENVWHTLMLLRERPEERLNRSLRRGRAVAVHE